MSKDNKKTDTEEKEEMIPIESDKLEVKATNKKPSHDQILKDLKKSQKALPIRITEKSSKDEIANAINWLISKFE